MKKIIVAFAGYGYITTIKENIFKNHRDNIYITNHNIYFQRKTGKLILDEEKPMNGVSYKGIFILVDGILCPISYGSHIENLEEHLDTLDQVKESRENFYRLNLHKYTDFTGWKEEDIQKELETFLTKKQMEEQEKEERIKEERRQTEKKVLDSIEERFMKGEKIYNQEFIAILKRNEVKVYPRTMHWLKTKLAETSTEGCTCVGNVSKKLYDLITSLKNAINIKRGE